MKGSASFHCVRVAYIAIALCVACGGAQAIVVPNPVPNPAGAVEVNPKTAALEAGGSQAFACSVVGVANPACTWSVREGAAGGSIDGQAVYSAPSAGGTYHVVAAFRGANGEATITVNGPPAAVTVRPSAIYLAPGGSYTFYASVAGPSDSSVTWSVAEGASGGNVSSAGVYTAPSSSGTYHVVATSVANPAKSGTASVLVSPTPVVVVALDPHLASVTPGGTASFTATVTGTSDTAVIWSVQEGSVGGSISGAGVYSAPAAGGTFHVVATSHADTSKSDLAFIFVAPVNTWYNSTATIDTSGFSGVLYVLVDPARPSDLYAFAAYTGVYKSSNFGQYWSKISENDAALMSGRPWASAIDPDPNRDPATPPTMYTTAGYGVNGLLKSTDGGVRWSQMFTSGDHYACFSGLPDVYGMAIDPANKQHLLLGLKNNYCPDRTGTPILESLDGGVSWTVHNGPAYFGEGHYLAFVDSNTWIAVSIAQGSPGGTFLTTTAGRRNGVPDPSAWTKTGDLYHLHGGGQIYVDPISRVIYNPVVGGGIYRSTDRGATWSKVFDGDMSSVLATPNYLYAGHLNGSPTATYVRSARNDGVNWVSYTNIPSGLTRGWFYGSTAFDGTNWVILTPNAELGVWRYIERP